MKGFLYPIHQSANISIDQRLAIEGLAREREISMAEATRELIDRGMRTMNVKPS
jgi:hypothetical protein